MDTKEILEKALSWIESEMERAQKPFADKFDLTSLAFVLGKVTSNPAEFEAARENLYWDARTHNSPTYDVMAPSDAWCAIARALIFCN